MLLYPLLALLTPFPRIFIIKSNANNGRNPPSYLFPVIAFINKEPTGCINEEAIDAINEVATDVIIAPGNLPACFFSLFHILLFQSHHQLIDLIFLVTLRF